MHSHAPPPRRRSSAGKIIVVLMLLGFFFLAGLFLLGVGAFVITRAEAQQARAVAQREMAQARAAQMRAVEEARRESARAEEQFQEAQRVLPYMEAMDSYADEPPQAREVRENTIRVANREITLDFDQQGQVQMDGKSLGPEQLEAALRKASKGRESAVIVTIKAHQKCEFLHVSEALAICQKLDLPNVRIATAN